jgi:hypothetical protein
MIKAAEPQVEKLIKVPENVSPPVEANLPKMQRFPAITPKKRRMASVLDAVIETTKALSPAPKKITEATKVQAEAKAGPSMSTEMKPAAPEEKTAGHPKLRTKMLATLFDMLWGRNYPRKKY